MTERLLDGTAHTLPDDLRAALTADVAAVALWQSLTPLGRNEFICWTLDAKQPATRARRIVRTVEELHEGKRRPCCWAGCVHRTDKVPGKWQQAVMVGEDVTLNGLKGRVNARPRSRQLSDDWVED